MCYILFMKKKIWTIFLLIANCITIFFLFTLGLLFWIIELNFIYEPGFTRLELIKYVLFIYLHSADLQSPVQDLRHSECSRSFHRCYISHKQPYQNIRFRSDQIRSSFLLRSPCILMLHQWQL